MRVTPWLVVVFVSVVAAAEAAPRGAVPASETVPAITAVVADTRSAPLTAEEVVAVRVYSSPDVTTDELRTALDVAVATFAAASVNVNWKVCGPRECLTPPSPAERLVRLVRSPKGGSHDSRCLGDALIDAQKGAGILATVYVDRVRDLVRHLGIDHATLLGRTIAHEIGHLLLATNTHGTSGLMRELWSPEELLASRTDDWAFHPFDAARMRKRLTPTRGEQPRGAT